MVTTVECKVYLKNKWPMNVIPLMGTGPIKDWWKKDKHLIDDIPQWHPDAWTTTIGFFCMPSTSGSCLSSWNLSLNSAMNCPLVCSLLFQSEYRKTGISTSPRSRSSTRTTLPRMPSQANCPGVLVTPEQFGITSSAKVSRDTILKPCQGQQIQDEAQDMMVNILCTLRVFYTASS